MRFLKNKIARAKNYATEASPPARKKNKQRQKASNNTPDHPSPITTNLIINKASYQLVGTTPKGATSCKNIMKNYSRALVKFAMSKFAIPYLNDMVSKTSATVQDFRHFLKERRSRINCIKSLRELLLVEPYDNEKFMIIKGVFQQISEVFLKYFSVNWIFSSKVSDKLAHLKYRYKMLRRIQNPQSFQNLPDNVKEEDF